MPKPKAPKKRKQKPISPEIESLELDPDAWEKFERLIRDASKVTPRVTPKAKG